MAVTKISSNQQLNVRADLEINGFRLLNVGSPVSGTDGVNKDYVDSVLQGLDKKVSGLVATNGAETYTIVGGAVTTINGTQIDGVTVTVGSRILIKNAPAATGAGAGANSANTSQPANGIYEVTNATTNLTVVRASDANTSGKVTAGMYIFTSEGTNSADNGYVLITNDTIVLNTTPLLFTQYSGAGQINAGNGLFKNGNTIDVVGTAGRIVANADSIDLATVTAAGTATSQIRRLDFDNYGRMTGQINATLADIITTIGAGVLQRTVLAGPVNGTGSSSFRLLDPLDIPNLSATKITTDAIAVARGGTGINNAAPANGQLLIGNGGTAFTLATLTQGTGVTITNGAGSITIANAGVTSVTGTANRVLVNGGTVAVSGAVTLSAPQDIHTGATPTFARLTLTDGTMTVSTPVITATQTWNAGAVVFEGIKLNITDTTSAIGSLLMDLEVGGVSRFSVRKDGAVVAGLWQATVIGETFGGTGQTVYAIGDILFANSTTTLSKLAIAGAGNVLISGSTPSWGKVALTTHISGTLPTANGGTGVALTTPANGQIVIGNGTVSPVWATISGSTTVSVTNGAGSISLAVVTGATGVITAPNYVIGEVPTGLVNGTNPTFTLASIPLPGKECVYVNGARQLVGAGNDYTISGNTITFLTGAIPQSGENVLVDYIK